MINFSMFQLPHVDSTLFLNLHGDDFPWICSLRKDENGEKCKRLWKWRLRRRKRNFLKNKWAIESLECLRPTFFMFQSVWPPGSKRGLFWRIEPPNIDRLLIVFFSVMIIFESILHTKLTLTLILTLNLTLTLTLSLNQTLTLTLNWHSNKNQTKDYQFLGVLFSMSTQRGLESQTGIICHTFLLQSVVLMMPHRGLECRWNSNLIDLQNYRNKILLTKLWFYLFLKVVFSYRHLLIVGE